MQLLGFNWTCNTAVNRPLSCSKTGLGEGDTELNQQKWVKIKIEIKHITKLASASLEMRFNEILLSIQLVVANV